jgi:hypothetical protein
MSDTCYYHPEAKAKATCAECTMAICDRCRLDGDLERCGNCASFHNAEASEVEATVPQAANNDDYTQPMCTNHSTLAADMQCLNCMRPFCLSCASTGYCPDCAPEFVNREGAAQRTAAASKPSAGYEHYENEVPQASYEAEEMQGYPAQNGQLGYESDANALPLDFDLAGSYLNDDKPAEARPRPRKRPETGARKPGAPQAKGGKKSPGNKKGASPPRPIGMMAGAVVLVLGLVGGGYWFMSKKGADAVPTGPMKVAITMPKSGTIGGQQIIKVSITSPDDFDYAQIVMDGKPYGAKLKKPPLETDWPTIVYPNGKHKVQVKAYYKGGKVVTDQHEYTIQNKNN